MRVVITKALQHLSCKVYIEAAQVRSTKILSGRVGTLSLLERKCFVIRLRRQRKSRTRVLEQVYSTPDKRLASR